MEPLGDYLKEIRESRNISIDKITKETHILKKFIYAIEKDEFSVFPGEAYLKGFLRNYSDYLGLEAQDIIKRYETIKLAEAPTPIEQLIPKPRPNFIPLIVVGVIAGLTGLGALSYFVFKNIKARPVVVKEKRQDKSAEGGEIHTFTGKESLFTIKQNDKIVITVDSKEYSIFAKEIFPAVKIVDPSDVEAYLGKGTPEKLDLNGDRVKDVELVLNLWDEKSAELMVRAINEVEEVEVVSTVTNTDIPFLEGSETIHSAAQMGAIDFTINVSAGTYLKYVVDSNNEVAEFFNTNSEIKISGKERVVVAMSNGGAVSFNFDGINKKITPAEAGKVDVKMFHWAQTDGGQYQLKMSSLK